MPGLDPGIQSSLPLDRRVKPGDDSAGIISSCFFPARGGGGKKEKRLSLREEMAEEELGVTGKIHAPSPRGRG
jgi:hypothetical protein